MNKRNIVLYIAFFLSSCGSYNQKNHTEEKAELRVANQTQKKLKIQIKDCFDETNVFKEVCFTNGSCSLGPSNVAFIHPQEKCFDVQAVTVDGKQQIIGTQTGLKLPPTINWVIY